MNMMVSMAEREHSIFLDPGLDVYVPFLANVVQKNEGIATYLYVKMVE